MTRIVYNNLSKADGSALIEHDGTIIQASVFGPADITQSKINYEEAVVEIQFKPKISIPSTSPAFDQVREIEFIIRSVFKEVILTRLHPRTSILILVQEIYNNGSLFSTTINAVCCALIDAGLPMKCPVSGVTIKTSGDGKMNSTFDFVFDNKLDIITILTRGGCVEEDDIKKALEAGREAAKKNLDTLRESVRTRLIG